MRCSGSITWIRPTERVLRPGDRGVVAPRDFGQTLVRDAEEPTAADAVCEAADRPQRRVYIGRHPEENLFRGLRDLRDPVIPQYPLRADFLGEHKGATTFSPANGALTSK